jgi:hypothetical protein
VPAGSSVVVDAPNFQVTPVSTWDDNSVKHALVAGRANFSAGSAKTLTFSLGSAPAGSTLTEADLALAAPQASVSYGSYGTVNLTTLLNTAARVRVEQAGPEYAAFQYIASFPNDASVRAVFYVQLWAGGKYRVRVAVENGTAQATTGSKSGTASVSIAGASRFSGSVSMADAVRWDAVGSNTTDVAVSHNAAYLRATKLVPNYGYTQASAATFSGLAANYTPMSRMGWEQDMGTTGYTPGIGLLPHWDALYASSGDTRALASSVAHSSAFGAFSVFYRNNSTKAIVKFSDFPSAYANSESLQGSGNSNRWEVAHHPNAGYLPWLATAERFHLETMEANAYAAWFTDSGGGQSGANKLYVSQTRSKAWRYRTIASLAAVAPDGEPYKADAKASAVANLKHWKTSVVDANITPSGLGATWSDLEPGTAGQQVSLFEHYFMVASVGWSSDQEMQLSAADMTVLTTVRDYFYRIPVGATGRGTGSSEYCYRRATGPYRTTIGPDTASFYANWGQIYNATYGDALACGAGAALSESYVDDPSDYAFPQGNWGHLMTALSYAADHGATGAAESYARITGSSNWSSNAAKFNNWPQYGVVRR